MSLKSSNDDTFDDNPFEPRPLHPYKCSVVDNIRTLPERDSRYCQQTSNQIVSNQFVHQGNVNTWNDTYSSEVSNNTIGSTIQEMDRIQALNIVHSSGSGFQHRYTNPNHWHVEEHLSIATTETCNISPKIPASFDTISDYLNQYKCSISNPVQCGNIPRRGNERIMEDFIGPQADHSPNVVHTNVNTINPEIFLRGIETCTAPRSSQGKNIWNEINSDINQCIRQQVALYQSTDSRYQTIVDLHSDYRDATIMDDFDGQIVEPTPKTFQGENACSEINRDIEPCRRRRLAACQCEDVEQNINHNIDGFPHVPDPSPEADTANISPKLNMVQRTWNKLKTKMENSGQTQLELQKWDRRNGLPNSHSSTMMHTNRSRRQLVEERILTKWNGDPLLPATTNLQEDTDVLKPKAKRRRRKI